MSHKVRFIDYPQQYEKIRGDLLDTIDTLLTNGDVMLRQQLRDFEAHLAEFVGTRFAVGTSNCTDALFLTLKALDIGAGDEVITVSHTFVATAAAIHRAGAAPILVDVGADHLMDAEAVEDAITARTRAIMPVHLNGRVCKMDRIMDIAERHNLTIVEDSAQALGASFKGTKGGAFGAAGCFSFYPAKLLGTYGDAGAVTTNDEALYEKLLLLRNHGRQPDNDISGYSYNHRMDNLHAAILDLKLKLVPEWIERRREIAAIYHEQLQGIRQIFLPPMPTTDSDHYDVFQNYEVEVEDLPGLRAHLEQSGIETMMPWGGKGVHQFPALGLDSFTLPKTNHVMESTILLPMHCELDDEQVVYVAQAVRDFYGQR